MAPLPTVGAGRFGLDGGLANGDLPGWFAFCNRLFCSLSRAISASLLATVASNWEMVASN